jgi:enoyl-CoA hydratase/carnithine racemase
MRSGVEHAVHTSESRPRPCVPSQRPAGLVLTADIYTLDQLPPGSIVSVVAEPAELFAAAESLLDGIATHPGTVTAGQRRLFDVWPNNPLDTSVNASMTEFAEVFESQDTHEQIARHHKRITR